MTEELLAPFDVIVVQDVSANTNSYTADEVEVLESWIRKGGGLMTLIGYYAPPRETNVNTLLEPSGLAYSTPMILASSGEYTVAIDDFWLDTHPIAKGISAVGFNNGNEVVGDGTVVAREDDFVVAQSKTLGKGRVFVFGDEWITFDSEWEQDDDAPIEYQIERFWLNSLQWLGPQDKCQVPTAQREMTLREPNS